MDHTVLSAKSILVVEDEPLLCLDIARRLEDAGAKVFAASNLQKALQLVEASPISAGVWNAEVTDTFMSRDTVSGPHGLVSEIHSRSRG
jgi:CheY-like chemotaxis protein